MNRQGWAVVGSCLLIALLSSGCACVDSCCMDSCDFGGSGCSTTCGSQSQPVVDSLNQIGSEWQSHGGCGGGCTGGCGLLSCSNWGRREHFIDGCGRPCYGPIAGIAMALRNSLMSCGCGELYVDEWLSDPPLCNDPCGTGCTACGECGPYVGPSRGCFGLGGCFKGGCSSGGCSNGGCSSGGCSAGGSTAPVEPDCGCALTTAEPSCQFAAGGLAEPSCGCIANEPDCGIHTSIGLEPDCGIHSGIGLEPDCGIHTSCIHEPGCGLPSTNCTANGSCGCKSKSVCGKIGCGKVAKGLLAGTATKVGCKVETFLADRKYKWSQRGRARTCSCRNCDQNAGDIADYRFDTPGQTSQPVVTEVSAATCPCSKCKAHAKNEAHRIAELNRIKGKVRQVDYTEAIGSAIR